MWEVVTFPVENNTQASKGQLDAHFESQLEAAEAIKDEIWKNRSIIERTFPTWFMSPGEVIEYLEDVRNEVINDLDEKVA